MRTQIALRPEQHAAVKARAAELGITMAEYIRRLVDRALADNAPSADPSTVIGIGASGGSNIAHEKDAAIRAAVAERHA